MGGPGSGRPAPEPVRFLLTVWKRTGSRQRLTRATAEAATAFGDALLRRGLADGYQVDRVETVARRVR